MTKTELRDALIRTKQLDGRSRSQEWINAFDAFNAAPENRNHKVTMGCNSCFSAVRNWLKS